MPQRRAIANSQVLDVNRKSPTPSGMGLSNNAWWEVLVGFQAYRIMVRINNFANSTL